MRFLGVIVANKHYPNIRKRKFSLEYYLDNFLHVLTDVSNWYNLNLIYKNEKTYHYKSIYNEYNKWSKDGIFENAFKMFMQENYFKISKVKQNKKINLFIDVVKISNKLGSEYVTINGEYRKKNVTQLTVICDQNKLPISVSPLKINKVIYNGRKTAEDERKNVQNTLNKIPIIIKKDYIKVNLIGDKGYITQNKFNVFNKEIKIITPVRKNMKRKNTKKEKLLLKNRYIIENFFGKLKVYNRIYVRKEKSYINYESFIYLALLMYYFNFIEKNNPALIEKIIKMR
jgi:hypothetical protein